VPQWKHPLLWRLHREVGGAEPLVTVSETEPEAVLGDVVDAASER
jgi:hypothetical protein